MSAQLNLNTQQGYGYFYDQLVVDWLVPQITKPDPNCFQNAVPGSPGIGRPFDAKGLNPDDPVFHNGSHALSPPGGGDVITLGPLAGKVIDVSGQGDGLQRVYVQPNVGNFIVVYGDLQSASVRIGQPLQAGDKIGTVRPAGDPKNFIGLHLTLVRSEYYNAFRAATKGAAAKNRFSTTPRKFYIDPNSRESPVNCLN